MSEVKVNKISPRTNCGTVTLGDSGDTFTIPSGATITNAGTATGFGATGEISWDTTVKTTGTFTATAGVGYFLNTTGGTITVNLPAGAAGSSVALADYAGTWQTSNVTVSPNGTEKIGGIAADLTLNTEGQSVTFVYIDSTQGWLNVQDSTSNERATTYIAATGGNQPTATGCVVCTNYKVHKFTSPGTFTITAGAGPAAKLDYLVMAGGGGGGGGEPGYYSGGGGGAGGFRESKTSSVSGCWSASPLASSTPLGPFTGPTAIPVTVGGGGAAGTSNNPGCSATAGGAGNPSVFSTITSTAGGGGGKSTGCTGTPGSAPARYGQPGGSGGGSGGGGCNPIGNGNTPSVSPPQGQNGGKGSVPSAGAGGGGGGAGGAGETWPGPVGGGCAQGGPSVTSHIIGSPVAYAEGGTDSTGSDGAVNTGKGGGSNATPGTAGAGGSGIVIIRYKFQ